MMATSVNRKVAALVTDSSRGIGDDADMRLYVREWRKHFRWSLERLGAALGISKSAVSKMEKGRRQSAAKYQDQIVEAWGITLEQLRHRPPEGQRRLTNLNDLETSVRNDTQSGNQNAGRVSTEGAHAVEDEDLAAWDDYMDLGPAYQKRIRKLIKQFKEMEAKSTRKHRP